MVTTMTITIMRRIAGVMEASGIWLHVVHVVYGGPNSTS